MHLNAGTAIQELQSNLGRVCVCVCGQKEEENLYIMKGVGEKRED